MHVPPNSHPVNTLLVPVHHKQHIWCDNGTSQREPLSCKKTDSPLLFTACYHGNTSINHTSQRWPDPRFLPGSRAAKMKPFQFTCWHTLAPSLLAISQVHALTNLDNSHKLKCACVQTRTVHMPADTVEHKHVCIYVPVFKKTQLCHFLQMTQMTHYTSQCDPFFIFSVVRYNTWHRNPRKQFVQNLQATLIVSRS